MNSYDRIYNLLEGQGLRPRPRERKSTPSTRPSTEAPTEEYGPTNFVGIRLHPKSKARLLQNHPNLHDTVHGDHITLHPPGEPFDENHPLRKHIGKPLTVHATHHASRSSDHDEGGVQALRVRVPKHIEHERNHPHVTISTSQGVSPRRSNDLLGGTDKYGGTAGDRLPDWLKLHGKVEVMGHRRREESMNSYERVYLMLTENETVEESLKKTLAGLAIAGALAAGGAKVLTAKAPKADPLGGRSALEVLDAGNKSTQKMLDQQRKNQAAKESERELLRHLRRNER